MEKWKDIIEEYSFYAEEENPTIEDIFVGFCDSFSNNFGDYEIGEAKTKFKDFEILSKLVAYKHLEEKGKDTNDLAYLINETIK